MTAKLRFTGRLIVASSIFAFVLSAVITPVAESYARTASIKCGVWRWPVKTLSDPARTKVNFTPAAIGVAKLRRLTPPGSLGTTTPRLGGIERRTFVVKAQVIEAKIEDDNDIHLVISNRTSRNHTMIVEFPRSGCIASPFKRPAIAAARKAMVANCGSLSTSSFTKLKGNVTIKGVGFWDEIHGQTGVAPKGIELHPVLKFTATCERA